MVVIGDVLEVARGNAPDFNGKVQLYRRGDSRIWQCAASVGGKQRRATTKREILALASEFAEDWYLGMRGKDPPGQAWTG